MASVTINNSWLVYNMHIGQCPQRALLGTYHSNIFQLLLPTGSILESNTVVVFLIFGSALAQNLGMQEEQVNGYIGLGLNP